MGCIEIRASYQPQLTNSGNLSGFIQVLVCHIFGCTAGGRQTSQLRWLEEDWTNLKIGRTLTPNKLMKPGVKFHVSWQYMTMVFPGFLGLFLKDQRWQKIPHVPRSYPSRGRSGSAAASGWMNRVLLHSTLKVQMWGFPKMGVPRHGWFIRENPISMDDATAMYGNPYVENT